MKTRIFSSVNTKSSPYVQIDTKKCKACWECLKVCRTGIISKVDLPWHKHAIIVEPNACTGCLNCMSICQYGAYSTVDKTRQEVEKRRNCTLTNFIINNLLLISGFVMIFSGFTLQFGFHMTGEKVVLHELQSESIQYKHLREIDESRIVCGFNYSVWSNIHKTVSILFLLLVIYHICIHWRWYKGIFKKYLIVKNSQVIILSILFIFVAATGLIPWFIDLLGISSAFRILFIEIHDKLALVLVIYLILHVLKRSKWFVTACSKLKR